MDLMVLIFYSDELVIDLRYQLAGARVFKGTGSNAVDLGDADGYLNWVFIAPSLRAPLATPRAAA
jgi:hypothetical protein